MNKIIDDYTHLQMSRQQKWILRHPDKQATYAAKYEKSEKRREAQRRYREKMKGVDKKTIDI